MGAIDNGQGMGMSREERKLYDRQLRVWGAEAQGRLKAAEVLVLGATSGIAGEMLKNLVLAGVGAIAIVEEGEGRSWLEGVAGKRAGGDAGSGLAAALADMNPFVRVRPVVSPASGDAAEVDVEKYAAVLVCGKRGKVVQKISDKCRNAGVLCYVAECRGEHGFFLSDLGSHSFIPEGLAQAEGKQTLNFPPIADALMFSASCLPKRRAPQLATGLRLLSSMDGLGRQLTASEAQDGLLLVEKIVRDEGFKPNCIEDNLLVDFLQGGVGDPAVDAIVGGVAAQDMIRAISGKGEPVCNFFCFSTSDGAGWTLKLAK